MLKRIYLISLITMLMASFWLFSQVRAEDSGAGLIISPPLKEKTIAPGESFTDTVKITNNTNNELKVKVKVWNFQARGEAGGQTFVEPKDDETTFSLAKWVSTEKSFTVKPQEIAKEISYTVKVPKDAEPGGHYAGILFSPSVVNTPGLKESGVMTIPEIGYLLLVTVAGDINYNGKIAEFSSNKTLYLHTTNLVDLATRFQNLGNIHVKPAGNIIIKNAFGSQVANLTVNEKTGNVLPQSIRKFTNQWTKKYGFGWYKANVNLTYGDNQNAAASLIFWIIPWKETLGVIIILIILIWIAKHIEWKKKQ